MVVAIEPIIRTRYEVVKFEEIPEQGIFRSRKQWWIKDDTHLNTGVSVDDYGIFNPKKYFDLIFEPKEFVGISITEVEG